MGLLFTFHPSEKVPAVLGPERKRLLDAAVRVFAAEDYARASLKRIAAEAQVTAPMVNYYFGGKQALFHAVVEAAFQLLEQLVTTRANPERAFDARVVGFVEGHEVFANGFTDAAELLVRAAFRPADRLHAHAERYEPLRVLARDILGAGVARGEVRLAPFLDVTRAADHLLAQVEVLLIQRVQHRRFPAGSVPRFSAEETTALFLDGARLAPDRGPQRSDAAPAADP